MARLRRSGVTELGSQQGDRRDEDDEGGQQGGRPVPHPQPTGPDRGEDEDADQSQGEPGREVPGDASEVFEDRERADEPLPAGPDPDVEPPREDQVRVPERDAENRHGNQSADRLPGSRARENVETLGRENERAVGVRGDHRQDRRDPERPAAPAAALDRHEKRKVRQRARQEEQRVHAPVDPVEQEHPARRDDRGRDQRGRPPREARAESRDHRDARHREERREEAKRFEAPAEVRDEPGDEEVERRAAALALHRLQQVRQRFAPDEEGEGLVLVGRPGGQACEQEGGDGDRARRHAEPERPRVGSSVDRGTTYAARAGRVEAGGSPGSLGRVTGA